MNYISEIEFLRTTNNSLRDKISMLEKSQKLLKNDHRKELNKHLITIRKRNSVSSRKEHFRKKINSVFKSLNDQLKNINYEISGNIHLKSFVSTEKDVDDFKIDFATGQSEEIKNDQQCLFSKDMAKIPDAKYFAFRKHLKLRIGTLYRLKKFRSNVGSSFKRIITKLSSGYYIDPVLKIKEQVLALLKCGKIKSNEKVWVKISCDGTKISRNVTLVNLVLNIINEQTKAASASGCYRIGIFKIEDENYECVKSWLPAIWEKIKVLTRLHYDPISQTFSENENENTKLLVLEYYFSADWKMMAIVLGLAAANSKSPCLYCETDDLFIKGNLTALI